MMPRPLLKETLGLSYRKIPILAIGREIYCDTSLIIEALEHYFPPPLANMLRRNRVRQLRNRLPAGQCEWLGLPPAGERLREFLDRQTAVSNHDGPDSAYGVGKSVRR